MSRRNGLNTAEGKKMGKKNIPQVSKAQTEAALVSPTWGGSQLSMQEALQLGKA